MNLNVYNPKYYKVYKEFKKSERELVWCTSVIPSLRVQGHHRESEASLNPLYPQKREKSTNYRAISPALFLNLENNYRYLCH